MLRLPLFAVLLLSVCPLASATQTSSTTTESVWHYRDEMLSILVRAVPGILQRQDSKTGRWKDGVWIVQDQHPIFSLAVAWSYQHPLNPFYHDPKVLEAIGKGGDALIAEADRNGQWVFRKKDKSTWGKIFMPWTYSRWVRTYDLVQGALPKKRQAQWEKALICGYTGIADGELSHTANIPTHHAMGLALAARLFGRDDWAQKARDLMQKVVENQHPDGYWSEHSGPVMGYNLVYCDALGAYYGITADPTVLPALERAARFHANFTYPNGSNVETIDERQLYHQSVCMAGHHFSHSPFGRGYMKRQWELLKGRKEPVSAETAASFLLYGEEGPSEAIDGLRGDRKYVTPDKSAMVEGKGKWFLCFSGYTAALSGSRWIQDRQNLVSLFSTELDRLILGGGNTKLTPLWSTFTVGDVGLLKHTPGDSDPKFLPPPGLLHVPSESSLDPGNVAMTLSYGDVRVRVDADIDPNGLARLTYSQLTPSTSTVAAHLPLCAVRGKKWSTESGRESIIGPNSKPWNLAGSETGGWFEHAGCRISVPLRATIQWPVAHHEQYAKYGEVPKGTGAIVLTLPFDEGTSQQVVTFTAMKTEKSAPGGSR